MCAEECYGWNEDRTSVRRKFLGRLSNISPARGEVVTLAHNNSFRDLIFDVTRHQRATSDREFTTLGSEKTLGSLWQMEEFASICSREELWEAVAD